MLQDDPHYLPDFDLMPLDLDRLDLDMTTTADDSQLSASAISSFHNQPARGR